MQWALLSPFLLDLTATYDSVDYFSMLEIFYSFNFQTHSFSFSLLFFFHLCNIHRFHFFQLCLKCFYYPMILLMAYCFCSTFHTITYTWITFKSILLLQTSLMISRSVDPTVHQTFSPGCPQAIQIHFLPQLNSSSFHANVFLFFVKEDPKNNLTKERPYYHTINSPSQRNMK